MTRGGSFSISILLLSVVAGVLGSPRALAEISYGWPKPAVEWARNFPAVPKNFKSSEAVTAWAAAKSMRFKIFSYEGARQLTQYSLKSGFFDVGSVNIGLSLRKNAQGEVLKRPLVVFLPGIFGDWDSPSVYRAAHHFGIKGFHVVGLPNPWSIGFTSSKPILKKEGNKTIVSPGSMEFEARFVLSAIRALQSGVLAGNVTETELVGESYGGLLATIVGASDTPSSPAVDGHITVLGPPLDIAAGLRALDEGLSGTGETYEKSCKSRAMRINLSLALASGESDWGPLLTQCVKPMMYQNFQENLVEEARLLTQTKGLGGGVPEKLGFEEFVRRYTPDNAEELKSGVKTHILYWVRKYGPSARPRLRIMTAQDDFLNRKEHLPQFEGSPLSWSRVADALNEPGGSSVIVLPWGGHVGFVGTPQFENLDEILSL